MIFCSVKWTRGKTVLRNFVKRHYREWSNRGDKDRILGGFISKFGVWGDSVENIFSGYWRWYGLCF